MTGDLHDSQLSHLHQDQQRVLQLKRELEKAIAIRDHHAVGLWNSGCSLGALAKEMGITRSAVQGMITRVRNDKVV